MRLSKQLTKSTGDKNSKNIPVLIKIPFPNHGQGFVRGRGVAKPYNQAWLLFNTNKTSSI